MNPKERSQLIDEFRILGSLNHPNIVEYIYHEHIPEEHMVYLYMEYCDGGDMSQIIKNYKKSHEYVPENIVWSIFTQLIMALYRCHYGVDPPPLRNIFQTDDDAENGSDKDSSGNNDDSDSDDQDGGNEEDDALDDLDDNNDDNHRIRRRRYRHKNDKNGGNQYKYSINGDHEPLVVNNEMIVIHRDIKPDNVFLLKDDNAVKLGDFGLAKLLLLESDFATTYVGTPYYMSPEVLMDKPYTPLSDIWSLGCVMYELCALHPPFQAKTHLQLQTKIKDGKFPPIPKHYSQKLRLTINACIMVDITDRPSSYLLLQEISVKIFRKELELNAKQQKISIMERNLKLKENMLLQERERLTEQLSEHIDQELSYHKKNMESELEQTRTMYQKEFQYVVEQEVNSRIKFLLQQPQFMQLIIEQVAAATGTAATTTNNTAPSSPSSSKSNSLANELAMLSLMAKGKGPKDVYDHLYTVGAQQQRKYNNSSNNSISNSNILKQHNGPVSGANTSSAATNSGSQEYYDHNNASSATQKYINKRFKGKALSANDENFITLLTAAAPGGGIGGGVTGNPNIYGAVTGSQNLNMNGNNVLNKATHANNAHLTKKKKYYNEFYEENTPSPFLRTFNTDL